MERLTGLPLLDNPDLLTQPRAGLLASIVWFQNNAAGRIPDGVEAVTRAVNGGVNGLAEREALTALATQQLSEA
jgi:predicted chitinase